MADPVITNVDIGSPELHSGEFRDGALVFAGAGTSLAGTILGRVTASGKFTPFVIGGSGGEEIPKAVLTYDVTATGAGDIQIRALTSGAVKKDKLIIAADGDGSNITEAILDQLRDYNISPVDAFELGRLDNQ